MTPENDFIKPVENLSNVGSLTPIDKHQQKRHRQEPRRGTDDEQDIPDTEEDETQGTNVSGTKTGSVDYRA
jgi:hypothetical protein